MYIHRYIEQRINVVGSTMFSWVDLKYEVLRAIENAKIGCELEPTTSVFHLISCARL